MTDLLKERIESAQGKRPADKLIQNVFLVNVFNGKIEKSNIYIVGDSIARVSLSEKDDFLQADEIIPGDGKYIFPGLIDAHTHIEMSFMSAASFVEAVIRQGTTGAVLDLHDIGNVGLQESIEFAKEIKATPFRSQLMLPPCIPSAPGREDAGCEMDLRLMRKWLSEIDIHGIGETMDFMRVVDCETKMLEILQEALDQGLLIEGHCPELMGEKLQAYAAAGVTSDHESVSLEEMLEKYRLGFKVILRRGSLEEPVNAKEFLDAIDNHSNVLLSTDGCIQLDTLVDEGTMLKAVRDLVKEGVNPVTAIELGTINVARAHGLDHQIGVIAPGRKADMVMVEDLKDFKLHSVFLGGVRIDEDFKTPRAQFSKEVLHSVKMLPVSEKDFFIPSKKQSEKVRVIDVREDSLVTGCIVDTFWPSKGQIKADVARDYLKISVFDRYKENGAYKNGFVHGFGFRKGALAGTVAQDSQNMIVVGVQEEDMALAVNYVIEKQGGIAYAADGKISSFIPLPVGGIMNHTLRPAQLQAEFHKLSEAVKKEGGNFENPSFVLAFMLTCPVIPDLKITNRALIAADTGKETSLFA